MGTAVIVSEPTPLGSVNRFGLAESFRLELIRVAKDEDTRLFALKKRSFVLPELPIFVQNRRMAMWGPLETQPDSNQPVVCSIVEG